eukprot:g16024.t1
MHSYSLNRTGNAGARVSDRYSSKYVGPNGGHLLHAPTTGAGGPASRSFRLSNSLPNSAEGGLLNVKRNTLKRISPVEDANGESCGRAVTKVKKVQSENQLVAHAVRQVGEDTSTRIEHQPGDPRLLQQNKDPSKPCASSSCSKINKRRSTRTVVIDTGSAAEYEEQLFTYLRGREKLFRASSNLHFDLGRRARVFDTLVRIHYTCRLREETLFICVNLYDRFLAKAAFKHDHPDYEIQFQLSGLACLLIASKYEDVHPPRCDEILEHIRKIAYKNNPGDPELLRKMSKERLLQMEIDVLNAVGFDINGGSPLEFLNRLMRVTVVQGESTKQRETVSQMAVYLMQLALIDASVSSVHDASAVAGTAL